MRITEKRLRSVIRNVLGEAMFGLYKRDKKQKGFKWGKWSRDVGPGGGSMADYYADDYLDGVDEVDELDESDEVEENAGSEAQKQKDDDYYDGVDE